MTRVDTAPMGRQSPKLDPREQHARIPGPVAGLELFARALPASQRSRGRKVVLYVHGGTFPSGLSIAHRFDGRSWRDELVEAGFDVWGFDFYGFGESDRYPEMSRPAEGQAPLGQADIASRQVEAVARFVCGRQDVPRISIIAHSWGTIAAGRFAGRCPELVDRLVFFGPIPWRPKTAEAARFPAWRPVSLQDQWNRFTAEVPQGEPAVLSRRHFDEWGERYLATDPDSGKQAPAAVRTPSGPWQDIADAGAGELAYDPGLIRAPVAIVRGEWDSLCPDSGAHWLFHALKNAPIRRDVKISRATHLMHLEENRFALYRETEAFLNGGDRPETR